jgi:hypothetical protein
VRGRTRLWKAVVGGGFVAALVVVGLILKFDGGVPLLPGRPPTTSDHGPIGFLPGGPMADADGADVRLSHLHLEATDLRALVGPQDSSTAPVLRASLENSVRNRLVHVNGVIDGDQGEVRSKLDGSTHTAEGALASVLLALIVLRASLGRARDRRQRAAAPVLAA